MHTYRYFILLLFTLLNGCGQTGPLSLPTAVAPIAVEKEKSPLIAPEKVRDSLPHQ